MRTRGDFPVLGDDVPTTAAALLQEITRLYLEMEKAPDRPQHGYGKGGPAYRALEGRIGSLARQFKALEGDEE